jgi:hypothetical protein
MAKQLRWVLGVILRVKGSLDYTRSYTLFFFRSWLQIDFKFSGDFIQKPQERRCLMSFGVILRVKGSLDYTRFKLFFLLRCNKKSKWEFALDPEFYFVFLSELYSELKGVWIILGVILCFSFGVILRVKGSLDYTRSYTLFFFRSYTQS